MLAQCPASSKARVARKHRYEHAFLVIWLRMILSCLVMLPTCVKRRVAGRSTNERGSPPS